MNNTLLTIFGFLIIFLATTLGSASVFFFKKEISTKLNALFFGLSAGIMIAASIWSLLLPAIEASKSYGNLNFIPATIGLILGGAFLSLTDRLTPHFNHTGSLHKPIKMFLAITVHNIPEGLAVGFAFGGAAYINTFEAFLAAFGLAVGIAIQNVPEGAAVSLPIKSATNSAHKAFLFGFLSGIVEPIFAIIGFFMASSLSIIQPWLLSFAAGAMLFVVADDLIPSLKIESSFIGTWGVIIGFAIMMILDVALS